MYRFFKKKREVVKKYLLIFFLSIVSIGMVITLAPIPSYNTGQMQADTLAKIYGQSIRVQDLQRNIEQRFRNAPAGYDSRIVPAVANSMLDNMILRRALATQASKLGIQVSDQELRQTLRSIPWLASTGALNSMDQYRDMVQQQTGLTVPEFEAELRNNLLLVKLRNVITDGIQVTPEDVHDQFLKENRKAKINYVIFDPSQYLNAVKITPQVLKAFFDKDPTQYKVPEERQVRYVLITPDMARSQAVVTDEEARHYYTEHLDDYRVPDRVKVAHILFKTVGKTPAEIATLEKTARNVLAQIKAGANFGDLAKKYSEDSSAANGGKIGWIVRGQTVKQFEDTAFALKPGQVSGLVKTQYGIHIIKVLDKQTAHLKSFDEVKDTIKQTLQKQKLEAAEEALADKLVHKFRANPQQFATIAKNAGLETKETPLFRYGQILPDFGKNENFSNLAFQLSQNGVGTPLSVAKGLAVIQVTKIVPEHVPSLDEVRARVEEDYRAQQSKVIAANKAREFAAKCKKGDFKKVAANMGLTVKESKDFTEQDYIDGVGQGSQIPEAFTLAPGKTSGVVSVGGTNVVFHVVAHTPPSEAKFAAQKDHIAEEVLARKREVAFEIYSQNLKQQLLRSGDLKLNADAMKAFLASYQKPS